MPTPKFNNITFAYTHMQLLELYKTAEVSKISRLIQNRGGSADFQYDVHECIISQEIFDRIRAHVPLALTETRLQTQQQRLAARLTSVVSSSSDYIALMLALTNCPDINETLNQAALRELSDLLSHLRGLIYKFHNELANLAEHHFYEMMGEDIKKIRAKLNLSVSLIVVDKIQVEVMALHNKRLKVYEFNPKLKLEQDNQNKSDDLILFEASLINARQNPNAEVIFDYLKQLYQRVLAKDNFSSSFTFSLLLLAYMPSKATYYIDTIHNAQVNPHLIQRNLIKIAEQVRLLTNRDTIDIKLSELDFSSDYYRVPIHSIEQALPYIESLLVFTAHFYWLSQSLFNKHLVFNGARAETIVIVLLIQLQLVIHHAKSIQKSMQDEIGRINALETPDNDAQVRRFKLQQDLAFGEQLEEKVQQITSLKTWIIDNIDINIDIYDNSLTRLFMVLQQQPNENNQVFARGYAANSLCKVPRAEQEDQNVSFIVAPNASYVLDRINAAKGAIVAWSSALKILFNAIIKSPGDINQLWSNNSPYCDILIELLSQYKESQYTVGKKSGENPDYLAINNPNYGQVLLKIEQLNKLFKTSGTENVEAFILTAQKEYTEALAAYLSIRPTLELDIPSYADSRWQNILPKDFDKPDEPDEPDEPNEFDEPKPKPKKITLKEKCELAFVSIPNSQGFVSDQSDETRDCLAQKYEALKTEMAKLYQEQSTLMRDNNDIGRLTDLSTLLPSKKQEIFLLCKKLARFYLYDLVVSRQRYIAYMLQDRLYLQNRKSGEEIPGMTLSLLVEVTQWAFIEALKQYATSPSERSHNALIRAAHDYQNSLILLGKAHVADLIPPSVQEIKTQPECVQLLAGIFIAAVNNILETETYKGARRLINLELMKTGPVPGSAAQLSQSYAASSVPPRISLSKDSDVEDIRAAYQSLLETLSQGKDISHFDISVRAGLVKWMQIHSNYNSLVDALVASQSPASTSTSSSSSSSMSYDVESLSHIRDVATWLERINSIAQVAGPTRG